MEGWEYEDLFDVLPAGGLMGEFWKRQATETLTGSMGYRTQTTKAGDRLEAEVYPIFGRSMEQTARRAKQNQTPERQKQLNMRRSKHWLILMLEANFRAEEDIHVTLTYQDVPDMDRLLKDLRNFFGRIRRLREKRKLPDLKYIYAIGHDKDQRPHIHVVMNGGIDRDELEKNWKKGNSRAKYRRGVANTYRLQDYGAGLQGMASYLFRQNEKAKDNGERDGVRMWNGSRNLKKPKIRTSDTKMSNRRVKMLALDFEAVAAEIMEKIYPGYRLEQGKVYMSDIVDGVYIRCVMRRMKP